MTARAQEVAAALLGTCKGLRDEATEAEQNDSIFLTALDQEIFCCDNCGWWCEVEQMHVTGQGQTCDDCFDESEDDERYG